MVRTTHDRSPPSLPRTGAHRFGALLLAGPRRCSSAPAAEHRAVTGPSTSHNARSPSLFVAN
ncbi:hypothetical protein DEJ51_15665 [Streptomyces venezuelae]|uniref:Uncharacterized protein n=1 Tax=Streptomyces venezuelae TaxID=54571 RepID=A0A5P2DX09_STRVZ|nr:hypothetical protein DEJ51_15665 [Streptomyces venezuelae]